MVTVTGSDGLTYKFENGVLTITGTGACTSMTYGKITSQNFDASSATKLIIGEGITTLNTWSTFRSMTLLESISFPSTLTEIGGAFINVGITTLVIPSSVTTISSYAFTSCSNLATIIFMGNAPSISQQDAFSLETAKATTIVSNGWATSSIFTSSMVGSRVLTFVTATPSEYAYLTYNGKKVAVDSAVRDGDGFKISTKYAKKTDLASYVENKATQSNSLAIGPSTTATGNPNNHSVAVGEACSANSDYSIAIGQNAYISQYSQGAIAIGLYAQISSPSKGYAIQLGRGNNPEAGTFYVGLGQSANYKLLGNDGKIPNERLQDKIFVSDTAVSSWSSDNTYADYPYRASIAITGVTASDTAEVVFGVAEATSGDYAPVCETYSGGVYIYSAVNTAITIPTIIIFKG